MKPYIEKENSAFGRGGGVFFFFSCLIWEFGIFTRLFSSSSAHGDFPLEKKSDNFRFFIMEILGRKEKKRFFPKENSKNRLLQQGYSGKFLANFIFYIIARVISGNELSAKGHKIWRPLPLSPLQ